MDHCFIGCTEIYHECLFKLYFRMLVILGLSLQVYHGFALSSILDLYLSNKYTYTALCVLN